VTKAFAITLGALTVAAAPAALAQEAPAAETAAPSSSFSDAELQIYAGVAQQLNKIQADAALSEAEKQAQMAAAVQQSGMDVAKFNAITQASKNDQALQKKLQESARP